MAPSWNVESLKGGLGEQTNAVAAPGENVHLLMSDKDHHHSDKHPHSSDHKRRLEELATDEYDPQGAYENIGDMTFSKNRTKWIILPMCKFRRTWIQITFVVALFIIWVTPVRVGFDMQAQGPWFWIEGIIDIFFYIDLVLNFFTAYEHPVTGQLITDHKRIAKRYLRSWFWIDLLATFPSDYIVKGLEGTWGCSFRNDCDPSITGNTAVSIIVLLRTTRVFRIIWIFKNFNVLSVSTLIGRLVDEMISMRWLFSILELFLVLVFLGHLNGCFFYMFSHPKWQTPVERQLIEEGHLSTWVLDKAGGYDVVQMPNLLAGANNQTVATNRIGKDLLTGGWYECPELYFIFQCNQCKNMQLRCHAELGYGFRYISAMYWAFTTMTTVGYGDIYATTVAEKVWAMVTMVIGGFFLSFCFGRIASIVSRLDADRAARAEQMESLTQFLKDHELPKTISRKVVDFFKSYVKGVKPYDRIAILGRLPFDLRSRILQHVYDTSIKSNPMLSKICQDDPAFMADFTMKLHPYHTTTETYVYQKGEVAADLYILVRGDVHVVEGGSKLVKIPEGSVFGETAVVMHLQGHTKVKRTENVVCHTACDMLKLTLQDAVELCEAYPELARALKRIDKTRQVQLTNVGVGQLSAIGNFISASHSKSTNNLADSPRGEGGKPSSLEDVQGGITALKVMCQELQGQVAALGKQQVQQQAHFQEELLYQKGMLTRLTDQLGSHAAAQRRSSEAVRGAASNLM